MLDANVEQRLVQQAAFIFPADQTCCSLAGSQDRSEQRNTVVSITACNLMNSRIACTNPSQTVSFPNFFQPDLHAPVHSLFSAATQIEFDQTNE